MKELLKLLKLTAGEWRLYVAAFIALVVGTATMLFVPPLFGRVLNSFETLADGRDAPAAKHALLLIAGLLTADAIATMAYSFLVAFASERIINGLRSRFFRNLLSQPLAERSPKQLGQIASEFALDLSMVQDGFSATLLNFLRHSIFTIGGLGALVYIDPKLTVVAFLGLGAFGGLVVVLIKQANRSIVSIQQYRAKMMSLLLEGAANAYIIQAYARTAYLSNRFNQWLDDTFRRVRAFLLISSCISPLSLMLFAMVMTAVAFYGMRELRQDNITSEQLITYCSYAIVLVLSGSQVGYLGGKLRQASLMLAKHQDMLAVESAESVRGEESRLTKGNAAGIPFGFLISNLTFTYPGKETPALRDVSLSLMPRQVNAIVGESGAGKSTIAALLCGLYQPQSGNISLFVEQGNRMDASPSEFSREIALVPQEPFLFAATITENITFGRDGLTDLQVRQAAMSARIHDFIVSLPEGYATEIQEGGKDLSRGQRQRISIARALVGNPRVILLDEATASLDVVSERAIKALMEDMRGRVTFVVIAHQGAMLSNVDHVIVLQHGEVLFEGHPSRVDAESKARLVSSAFEAVTAGSLC